ncbi:MAG: hypothetical protein C0467_28690 [Planctomycetaceae bacterium]|nr:hypothetical protein [Planctomycetaceae bacterium]
MAIAETTYFKSERCLVTSTRVVLDGVTYPMANITSVRKHKLEINRTAPLCMGAIGALMTFAAFDTGRYGLAVLGVPLAALAVFIWRSQKPKYVVVLGTAGQDTDTMGSVDGQEIAAIVDAITKAIIGRG